MFECGQEWNGTSRSARLEETISRLIFGEAAVRANEIPRGIQEAEEYANLESEKLQ